MAYVQSKINLKLLNGSEYELHPINADLVRWELEQRKNNWPTAQEAPTLWANTLAWSALKRSGQYTDTLEKFIEEVEYLTIEAVEVPPTIGATPGASA